MTSPSTEQRTQQQYDERRQQDRQDKEQQAREQSDSGQQFNQVLDSMIPAASGSGALEAQIAWQAFFDLADQSVRASRRVSEALFINGLRSQIVQEVRAQVLADLSRQQQRAGVRGS